MNNGRNKKTNGESKTNKEIGMKKEKIIGSQTKICTENGIKRRKKIGTERQIKRWKQMNSYRRQTKRWRKTEYRQKADKNIIKETD